jgi:hypothetical protein
MRAPALLIALAACSHGSGSTAMPRETPQPHATFTPDDEPAPPYDRDAVGKALVTERAAATRQEREVLDAEVWGDPDRLIAARADLAVRRRFIATLELCESEGRRCPPRLDDPPWPYAVDSEEDPKLDVPLRFDPISWHNVTAELHGRACACRTLACIESMDATLERLETRPVEDVRSDEVAAAELTGARDCLMRLRGKRPVR